MKNSCLIVKLLFPAFCFFAIQSFAQSQAELKQLMAVPKTVKTFPLNYKIALPDPDSCTFGYHMEQYEKYLTPLLIKTQQTLSSNSGDVTTVINYNSVRPHAQLDTSTLISNEAMLKGTWRMIVYRSIRFNDSLDFAGRKCYHLPDTLLAGSGDEEALVVFTDRNFKMFIREPGKVHIKKATGYRYQLENRRYLMLYTLSKAGADVSQAGIDENGYLILNTPKVIMYTRKNSYVSYYSIIEQYIFERIKQ